MEILTLSFTLYRRVKVSHIQVACTRDARTNRAKETACINHRLHLGNNPNYVNIPLDMEEDNGKAY